MAMDEGASVLRCGLAMALVETDVVTALLSDILRNMHDSDTMLECDFIRT
jgi:hypothetical protein